MEGVLLVDKPAGPSSFGLIRMVRRLTGVKKVGHAGTLDPFATGVMVILIGRRYTRLSQQFLCNDKEYAARLHLGITTDSYDCEGQVTGRSTKIPTAPEIDQVIASFQGEIGQVPPMFSAKKVQGKKLYELARKGLSVHREEIPVQVSVELISYSYPHLQIRVKCSKGTYVRGLAHEMGALLGCGAHLDLLQRTASGPFHLKDCLSGAHLQDLSYDLAPHLLTEDKLPGAR